MILLTSFLSAMFAAVIMIPPLTALYQKLNIVDLPSARKVHTSPIPRVGGIAIVIATVIPMFWWLGFSEPMYGVFFGIAILFLVGVLDDAKNLSYKIKFILQALSIVALFYFGYINLDNSYYGSDNEVIKILLFIIYFGFILGVTNAINLTDGLDGLAGGIALLSLSIIGLLAYESNNTDILIVIVAVIGSVFGFLRFNSYPAKIFMGDTGSLFLGFILGLLSISITYGEDSAYAKTLPLLLIGLPIFDTLMVIVVRIINRKSPFEADRNHFHHRFLDHGFKHYQSVLVIYAMQSMFVLTAYYMRYDTDFNIIIAFILLCLVFYSIEYISSKRSDRESLINNKFDNLLKYSKSILSPTSSILFSLLSISLFAYIIMSAYISDVSQDISYSLVGLALITVVLFTVLKNKPLHWVERIIVHIMIVLSIYFSAIHASEGVPLYSKLHFLLLVSCIVLIGLHLLSGKKQNFIGSPLDYLLIATAIIIPNLPGSPLADTEFSFLVLKLVILFYCFEYMIPNISNKWWLARAATLLFFITPFLPNFMS